MTTYELSQVGGGALVALIGVTVGVGGVQLKNGRPSSWPDIVARDPAVRSVARGMMAVAVVLVVAGVDAAAGGRWGRPAATAAVVVFVAGAFGANSVLFGKVRLAHMATNVVVGALIMWLLWQG